MSEYNLDLDFIRKEAGLKVVTRKQWRNVRKSKPTLPPDKVLAKRFGSFARFVSIYKGERVPEKHVKKVVSKKGVKKDKPKTENLSIASAENFTDGEKQFVRIVGEYRESQNIAFPSIIEIYRLARKFLNLEDEHKDKPVVPEVDAEDHPSIRAILDA